MHVYTGKYVSVLCTGTLLGQYAKSSTKTPGAPPGATNHDRGCMFSPEFHARGLLEVDKLSHTCCTLIPLIDHSP